MSNKYALFAAGPTSVDFPAQEEQILAFWEEGQHFARSVAERPEDKPFIFYDGPPFASGLPHYGHLLASIIFYIKDHMNYIQPKPLVVKSLKQ